MQQTDSENISVALKAAQALVVEGRFSAALTAVEGILGAAPENLEALYMRAVAQRYSKRFEQAKSSLQALKAVAPEFGRAYQEEGHLYRELGEHAKALTAYQAACEANPALLASWLAQAKILSKDGRLQEAAYANAQAERLKGLPPELVAVTNLIYEGKLLKAEQLCKQFLLNDPHHVEGMRLLAEIASRLGVLDDAELLLASANKLAPDNIQVQLDYIQLLRKRQKFTDSLRLSQALCRTDSENPLFVSQYAIDSLQNNHFEQAIELFDRVLARLPDDPATLTSKGHALKTFGQHEQAITCYRKAYQARPDHGDAYYALANLKTYRFSDAEINAMQALLERDDLSYHNRIHLCFALGKAYEDRHDFAQSFDRYVEGNALKQTQCRYKSGQMTEELEAQAAVCDSALFAKQTGGGATAADPIFIVGLPRAGSTLLEQILASHSQVDGTLELPNILALAHRLRGGRKVSSEQGYPSNLRHLSTEQLTEFGHAYLEQTRIHRQDAPFFIDKMPNNFRHIGLIHLILPNARIIDARRHPMACCFSGFKQLFAEGQEFTYGLQEIGTYYRDYVAVMEHWDRVLPGKVLRVQYEDVVADTETQVRRMLAYLGLAFEEGCIEFHKTERSVRTASSEQVRQPIFQSGLQQWRNFEPYLEPLKQALGPALENF